MRVFSNITTCLHAVFRQFRRNLRPPHIISDARNVPFALFRAVGAARSTEMQPIENRGGRGTLAFDSRHLRLIYLKEPLGLWWE